MSMAAKRNVSGPSLSAKNDGKSGSTIYVDYVELGAARF